MLWKRGEKLLAVAHNDHHWSYEPPWMTQKGDLRQEEENVPSPPRGRAEPDILEVAGAGMATKPQQHGHWV